jgi:hypothetical protein
MSFQFQPGDTAAICFQRLLNQGDIKEPLAQYIAQVMLNFNITGGGDGGDGGGTDPNAVQKTGDTMTGTLIIAGSDGLKGLQITSPWSDLLDINSCSITVGNASNFGSFITLNDHTGTVVRLDGNGVKVNPAGSTDTLQVGVNQGGSAAIVFGHSGAGSIQMFNDGTGKLRVQTNGPTIIQLGNLTAGFYNELQVDPATGDLIVYQAIGPNAGKSINLTNGFAAVAATSGGTLYSEFQWVPDGQSNPGYGAVSGNATTPATCTVLAVSDNDRQGVNVAAPLRLLGSGGRIAGQDPTNADAWIRYNVTGAATHQSGGYTYIPVSVADQGTAATTGWSEVNIAFSI